MGRYFFWFASVALAGAAPTAHAQQAPFRPESSRPAPPPSIVTVPLPPPRVISATPSPVDSARLAIARDIVALGWPEDRREKTMDELLKTVLKQYSASLELDSIEDKGLRRIMDDSSPLFPNGCGLPSAGTFRNRWTRWPTVMPGYFR